MFLHVLIKRDHIEAIQSDADISSNQQGLCQASRSWWPGAPHFAWQYPVLLKTRGSGNRNLRNKIALRENAVIWYARTLLSCSAALKTGSSAESDESSGRPLSIRDKEATTKLHELVTADRRLACRKYECLVTRARQFELNFCMNLVSTNSCPRASAHSAQLCSCF